MKRAHAIGLGAAALAAASLPAGSFPAAAETPQRLRVGASIDQNYAEGFYAYDLGYFKDAGFDANITTLVNGGALNAALFGGAIDVAIGDLGSVSAAHVRGLPIVILAPCALYSSALLTHAIVVEPNSPIHDAKDLTGKKLGLTSLGSLMHVGIQAWIDKNGGNAASVQYVEIPLSEMILAVRGGRVDAVGLTEPWISQAAGQTRLLGAPFTAIGDQFLITAWTTTRTWLQANPEAARRFDAMIRHTATWVNANPKPSAAILSKYLHIPLDTIERMHRTRMATSLDASMIQPVVDAAARYKLIPRGFAASELVATA
jgi:NitT/TauT family transport system substrate-binding protein